MIALTVFTILLLILTLLPLIRYEVWWIRGWDFPRFQLAVFAIGLLIADLIFLDLSSYKSIVLLVVVCFCLIYQAWWILPYTRLYPKEVKSTKDDMGERVRLIASNVLTTNKKAHLLLDLIREHDPDIVIAVETDEWWEDQLDFLEPSYAYTIKCPRDDFYGMHLYSRFPLKETKTAYLVEGDKPSMHVTAILPSGEPIRMHFVHPAPPSPTENEKSSERDAELLVLAKTVVDEDSPVIVAGDLNDVAWSATTRLFRKISGLLDPRVGRGMFNTFHAEYPFLRWPLDHIFHSSHFTFGTLKVLDHIGSDHFPILVELFFHKAKDTDQESLESDAEDHEWAEEKLETENVEQNEKITA